MIKGVNTYARCCIAPTEDQQTSKQGRQPYTSWSRKLKVTSTHPGSDCKQRGKWGRNQQVLPFTYMKAQRESGQWFKSASSKPRLGRAFFHVNEPIDKQPDTSIWTTMYTQRAPRGESYTMIVLRVGGTNDVFAKYCHIKASHFAVPAPPELAIRENEQNTQEPTVQYWCLGLQLVKFAVKPSAFNYNSHKIWHPTASDMQPVTGKEICHGSPFFTGIAKSREKRIREQSSPIYTRPHPCGYLYRRTMQGLTCKLRDRYPVEFVTSDRSSVVISAQYASPPRLLRVQTRHNKVLCDFKTLIICSTAT